MRYETELYNPYDQMSESFLLSAFLAFSGGFQDAYTYIVRGGVFANAQTGNVVLMSVRFMEGQWMSGLKYLLPLFAFIAGVFITENIQSHFRNMRLLHWRQLIIIAELAIMVAAGFMPLSLNMPANILISLSCAMQVQAFRTVHGNIYASTMCIGNLRSGTAALSKSIRTRRPEELKKALYYFGVIFVFALGAGTGGVLSGLFGIRSIWFSCATLLFAFLAMFIKPRDGGRAVSDGETTR